MKTKTRRAKTDPNKYPRGLNYNKTMALAKYYDALKDEVLVPDDAEIEPESMPVWMEVPPDLVPQVRKLIAKHRKSA